MTLCHLLEGQSDASRWNATFCATCPVPDIKRANGCENLRIHARIGKRKWRFWEEARMLIDVTCTYTGKRVENPYVGCGHCHGSLEFIVQPSPEAGTSDE